MDFVGNWGFLLFFMVLAYLAMRALDTLIQRILKVDRTEKEQVLQSKLQELTVKVKKYEDEVASLRQQVQLLLNQYTEISGRYKELESVYAVAKQDANSLRDQLNNMSQTYSGMPARSNKVLIVCVGSKTDSGLALDMASIRAVRTETGFEIQQVSDPSPENLKKMLDRARLKQEHIYLHLAVKADKDGYQIGSQIVDASWLSSILNNVLVLLVAGSDSDSVGDFLGVVPYVITMSGGVDHREAAVFSRLFWTEIGRGLGPTLALRRALDRSPGNMREFIVSHWEF